MGDVVLLKTACCGKVELILGVLKVPEVFFERKTKRIYLVLTKKGTIFVQNPKYAGLRHESP